MDSDEMAVTVCDLDFSSDTKFEWYVRAFNGSSSASMDSLTRTFNTLTTSVPDVPTGVAAAKADDPATGGYLYRITWTDNAENEQYY